MDEERVGTVAVIARYPVKSMLGERLAACAVGPRGLAGDRGYALVDRADGTVASAKHPRKWGRLLGCRATYVEPPEAGGAVPPVEIALRDGSTCRSDLPGVDDVLSRFTGRDVALASVAPGFVENSWPGRTLRFGADATARVSILTMRCVMTTLEQGDLPQDRRTLQTVAAANRVEIPGLGTWACAGAYADIEGAGEIREGDEVAVSTA